MSKYLGFVLLLLLAVADAHSLSKRVLPTNENCDPDAQVCRKGDWIAEWIADCEYDRSLFHPFSCDAQNDVFYSWTVDVAIGDRCIPSSGKRFSCGQAGTSTRCVCSDYKIQTNECRCQYWPDEDHGASLDAFCTGYYTGGTSGLHHWACCDNCNGGPSSTVTCDGYEWHGGSSEDYCGSCGQNQGGGRDKYYFNCGGCSQQNECKNYCSGPIRNLPGLCWRWLDCFKSCCLACAQQPSQDKRQMPNFCGDGVCSDAETPTSCPVDCCYQINDACSGDNPNVCELECCGSSGCCLNTTAPTGPGNSGCFHLSSNTVFIISFVVYIALYLFIH